MRYFVVREGRSSCKADRAFWNIFVVNLITVDSRLLGRHSLLSAGDEKNRVREHLL